MKLLPKLLIILLIVTLIPLGVSAYFSIKISQNEVTRGIEDIHAKSALHLAESTDQYIEEIITGIRLSLSYLKFGQLSDQEKIGALRIIYSQFEPINIVSLLNEKGAEVVPSVFLPNPQKYGGELARHLAADPDDLKKFFADLPLDLAAQGKMAVSQVYSSPDKGVPLLGLALPIERGRGKSPWILATELSLGEIQKKITQFSVGKKGLAFLVDGSQRIIAHPDFYLVRSGRKTQALGIPDIDLQPGEARALAFRGPEGVKWLGAYSPLSVVDWGVVVSQPARSALTAVERLKKQNLFWMGAGLLVAVIISIVFARSLSRPVEECAQGAREVARGNFDRRLPVESRDEIGDLSQAFNFMAEELKKSIFEIERQNEEIRRWNVELQDRVEERTRELKKTQDQLLQAQKMAAVGELGAGIAHELNNPLVGILGFAQLQLMKKKEGEPDYRSLKRIEQEALRCKEIINNLLIFTQGESGAEKGIVSLSQTISEALAMIENQFSSQGIAIKKNLPRDLPALRGDSAQLKQVFIHLLTNARNAMPNGGELKISARVDGRIVILKISDTGKGIPPENLDRIFDPFFTTKDKWENKGMGLAIVYRIVEDHKGAITVESEVGKGTTFTLTFPAAVQTQLV